MSQGTKLLGLISTLETQSANLRSLFADQEKHLNPSFKRDLKKLRHFYERSFWETSSIEKREGVVKEYQSLVSTIEEVKNGSISAEEALKKLDEPNQNRQNKILVDNLIKTCEFLFWLAVTVVSCGLCLTVGIPLIYCNPLLGVALSFASSFCAADALVEASDCLDELQSLEPLLKQEKREQKMISFFSNSSLEIASEAQKTKSEINPDNDSKASYC